MNVPLNLQIIIQQYRVYPIIKANEVMAYNLMYFLKQHIKIGTKLIKNKQTLSIKGILVRAITHIKAFLKRGIYPYIPSPNLSISNRFDIWKNMGIKHRDALYKIIKRLPTPLITVFTRSLTVNEV